MGYIQSNIDSHNSAFKENEEKELRKAGIFALTITIGLFAIMICAIAWGIHEGSKKTDRSPVGIIKTANAQDTFIIPTKEELAYIQIEYEKEFQVYKTIDPIILPNKSIYRVDAYTSWNDKGQLVDKGYIEYTEPFTDKRP